MPSRLGVINESSKDNQNLCLIQAKGKLSHYEAENSDIISSLAFNDDGSMLAVGDRGGRIVVLSRNNKHFKDQYNVFTTFISHEPDFDYLKSIDIEEKINKIAWFKQTHDAHTLLTTNDKTIKLFKIYDNINSFEKSSKMLEANLKKISVRPSHEDFNTGGGRISRQLSWACQNAKKAVCRRVYNNAHHYNIHTVNSCPNQEYFISSDDLRINLWSLERSDICFTVVDCKPENMELLSEIITSTAYHPSDPDVFLYSTSRGQINMCDTRVKAICDVPIIKFFDRTDADIDSRFSEAIISVSCINFASNSQYFLSRNYLQLKIWDTKMPREPLETIDIQEFLYNDSCLSDLYDNEFIFDRFEACFTNNDNTIITGSYYDTLCLVNRTSNRNPSSRIFYSTSIEGFKNCHNHFISPSPLSYISNRKMNFNFKVSFVDRHPISDIVAVASHQNLLIYDINKKQPELT